MATAPKSESSKSPDRLTTLPHNIEAEKKVLGSMLLDREVIPEVDRLLTPEDFFQPAHQTIYRHLADLYNDNKPSDLTLLIDSLQKQNQLDDVGGYLYIATLETHVFSSSAAVENAQLVQDKATLRRLIQAADHIIREAQAESDPIAEIIENAEGEIYKVNRTNQTGGFEPINKLMTESLGEILHLYETKQSKTGLKTHFIELDKILGGFDNTALVILAARPSMGKTAFAINLVRNVAFYAQKPVAVFSLEMGAEQLNMRILSGYSGVSSQKIMQGKISDVEWEKIRETASLMMELPIFIDDTPSISIMQLRSRARRLQAQYKNLGLIVVDYLQLMQGSSSKREQNRQQEVAEISRGLKGLAKELRVPVLALSQLSRNIEQRAGKDKPAEPQLSDLRESGSIEQDADIVMFVHRERKELERDENGLPMNKNQSIPASIIVGKNRNGPIGRAEMIFIPSQTRFADLGDEMKR
ncbi:MAG: replicative DNA helicase [Sumerlaeia bacterium]